MCCFELFKPYKKEVTLLEHMKLLMRIFSMMLTLQLKTLDYMKHLMCDVQQRKAKTSCLIVSQMAQHLKS